MAHNLMVLTFNTLLSRSLPEGGFTGRIQGGYRPDATAWAILALEAWGYKGSVLQASRDRLAAEQRTDGRVCLSPAHEDVFWPTSLAILAWQSSAGHKEPKTRAVRFLLKTSGKHWPRRPKDAAAHDTSLRGWPWSEDTHSWVEPTALAIMALKAAGFSEHERVQEAEKMLMDRQLPRGGWNYGNTVVLLQELRPMPESTGLALDALSGSVPRQQVEQSLQYLITRVSNLKTPRSLAWSLLGLGAWGERPKSASEYIAACLTRSGGYGDYDTASLALLLLAFSAHRGLLSIFKD